MSRGLQWVIGIGLVVLVAAILFSVLWPFVAPRAWGYGGYGGYGMMGPGHMFGGGMMGGFGMPFFGVGMFLGPLLTFGVIALGAVWLVRALSGRSPAQGPPPAPAPVACAHCGRPLQADWKACPYCGEKV